MDIDKAGVLVSQILPVSPCQLGVTLFGAKTEYH